MSDTNFIWIFVGNKNRHPSGIFTTKDMAEKWIIHNKLTGLLTKYPLNISIYEWVIREGYLKDKTVTLNKSDLIANFNSSYLEHFHFEEGKCDF